MDTQEIGLDNEKDAMTSLCLGRKYDAPPCECTVLGPAACADRISNCPLDRVLTYKNLIYLLNLQFRSVSKPRKPVFIFITGPTTSIH